MRLGVIYEPAAPNSYYRAVAPMHALEQRGHSVVWPTRVDAIPTQAFLDCDLVHCYRRLDRLDDLRKLSRHGVAISFDNDDNFAAAEMSLEGDGLEGHLHNQEMFKGILTAAQLADLTTTPSELLAERYRAAGARNVAVIENHLGAEMVGLGSKSEREGFVVGWVASREHKLDLERIPVVDALKRLLELHPGLRVMSVGMRLPLHSDRYEYIPFVPFAELLEIIGRIDIGIAPLADNAFNRSRSNVKLKEYSSGGAAWLASPVGPYRELGASQGGLLVGDQEWGSAIDLLICNPRRRKRLARRARKWAKAQTIDRFAAAWEDQFLAATETVGGRNERTSRILTAAATTRVDRRRAQSARASRRRP
jgi:glycosyltransferase involved in cell wall biosynthesis